MRQEKSTSNAVLSPIPNKNFRGLKALLSNNNTTNDDLIVDDMISDHELALRKAGESGISFLIISDDSPLSIDQAN